MSEIEEEIEKKILEILIEKTFNSLKLDEKLKEKFKNHFTKFTIIKYPDSFWRGPNWYFVEICFEYKFYTNNAIVIKFEAQLDEMLEEIRSRVPRLVSSIRKIAVEKMIKQSKF